MGVAVSAASARHDAAIVAIGSEYGLIAVDAVSHERYRDLLRGRGRLLVAELDGTVIGFGGMIEVPHRDGPVAMITDLFVTAAQQGAGAGRMLGRALVEGYLRRMTFTSRNPAARHLYGSLGMTRRWTLRSLRGAAQRCASGDVVAWAVDPQSVATDRRELLALLGPADCYELLVGGEVIGHAIAHDNAQSIEIHRVVSAADHAESVRALLTAFPEGRTVVVSVSDASTASAALDVLGFEQYDHDLHMSSEPDLIPAVAFVVNPGLA